MQVPAFGWTPVFLLRTKLISPSLSFSFQILFLTDIFGFSRPRAQTVADFIAQETGSLVVVPDLFFGKPWDPTNFPPSTDEEKAKFQVRQVFSENQRQPFNRFLGGNASKFVP